MVAEFVNVEFTREGYLYNMNYEYCDSPSISILKEKMLPVDAFLNTTFQKMSTNSIYIVSFEFYIGRMFYSFVSLTFSVDAQIPFDGTELQVRSVPEKYNRKTDFFCFTVEGESPYYEYTSQLFMKKMIIILIMYLEFNLIAKVLHFIFFQ